jgi:hypothetical protein
MGIISKNIENLKPDKEYIVTVRAKNSDVNVVSDYTDSVRFRTPTDSTIPNAPVGLLLAASFLNVLFKYDDSIDPDHARYEYELYKQAQIQSVSGLYQIISGETPHRTGFVQTNVFVVSVDDNSYTNSTGSVTNFVKYYGRVRSIDSSGNISDWTNIVQSDDTPLIDEQFIGSLTAAKITAGTIGAHTIVLSGSTSIIQSANFNGTPVGDGSYSSATTGWLINGQGKAYFYDATVVGSIDIGGFDSGSFHVNTSGDMWLGAGTYGAAPFRVSRDGVLEIGAGTGSRIGGQLVDTVATAVIDFNGRNNRNYTPVAAPTLPSPVTVGNLVIGARYTIVSPGDTNWNTTANTTGITYTMGSVFIAATAGAGTGTVSGETIDHTLNTDGSANISFEWNYTYSSADNAANNIDGFYVHIYSSDSSSPYVIGTTPNLESTYPVDYLKRSIVFSGLPADKYYTFGVKAFRVVDSNAATPGIIYSSMVQSSVTEENPYRPSANVNYTGNISGTLASTVVSYANAGNTVATNFNTNNDSNGLTPTSPTLPSSIVATSIKVGSTYTILIATGTTNAEWNTTAGTTGVNYIAGSTFTAVAPGAGTGTVSGETIDHTINTDGSVDISFEWLYTHSDTYNAANNIDGFIVYHRSSTIASAYTIGTTPAEETTYYLPREKRAFILPGVAANKYHTLGVRAYRMVNSHVATPGIVYSSIVQSSVTGENPYQPLTTVAFAGNITGTIDGTAVTTITAGINNFNNNNDSISTTPATPTSALFGTATSNRNASIDLPLTWEYNNNPISISSASHVSVFATTNYNTSVPHGFTTGNTVAVTGITPSSFNNTATITVASATQFYFSGFNGNPKSALDTNASTTFVVAGVTVTAGSFVTGRVYTISTVGSSPTDFTAIGAANNTIGTVFTATGPGTGNGTASFTGTNVTTAGNFLNGQLYTIVTPGTTNFVALYGAVNNNAGTTFTANSNPGTGTGTAGWSGTVTGVTGTVTGGSSGTAGSGAVFTIQKTGSLNGFITANTVVTVTNGGSNYQVGNIITIPGASLGGTTPTNNLALRVVTKSDGLYGSGGSAINEADAYNVDGFVVFLRTSESTDASNITTANLNTDIQQVFLTAEKRSHTFSGISPSSFYRAAVRPYRAVYAHVNSAGVIYGPLTNTAQRDSLPTVLGGSTGITIGNGKIYIGAGNYASADTGFYADATPNFSLGNKLTWNGTTLTVTGALNATSGTFTSTVTVGGATSGTLQVGTGTNKIKIVGTSADAGTYINTGSTTATLGNGFYFGADGKVRIAGSNGSLTFDGTSLTINGGGTFTGALSGGTIDIGGADTTSFHVDSTGKMWLGAALYDDATFKVSAGGAITAQSGSIAGWSIGVPEVTAGYFIIGEQYKIFSPGNTSFTSIGAANNNVNTVFTATGIGSGTGTAKPNDGVNTLTNGSGTTLSILSPQGWAWFSSGVITKSISGYGGPTTTGGAASSITTTVSSGTRGYLRNISYGTNAQKPTSPVLGDIHFTS